MTTLAATVSAVMHSVTFDSCRLLDSRIVNAGAYFRYARNGSLYGYKRAQVESLTLDFGNMNRPKIQEILDFLNFSAGYQATLTLDNGDIWTGHVLDDPWATTHDGQRNNSFSINFEGTQTGP